MFQTGASEASEDIAMQKMQQLTDTGIKQNVIMR